VIKSLCFKTKISQRVFWGRNTKRTRPFKETIRESKQQKKLF